MILADVNVLVYAHRADASGHAAYRVWLEAVINRDQAAPAIESGSEWITTDRDYSRFPGLKWRHPLDD